MPATCVPAGRRCTACISGHGGPQREARPRSACDGGWACACSCSCVCVVALILIVRARQACRRALIELRHTCGTAAACDCCGDGAHVPCVSITCLQSIPGIGTNLARLVASALWNASHGSSTCTGHPWLTAMAPSMADDVCPALAAAVAASVGIERPQCCHCVTKVR